MSTFIHPTAIVSPDAKLGDKVRIGPFAIVESDVEIGEGTEIRSSAIISNGARIGKNCKIFSNAVISSEPQDLKFHGEETLVIIGDNTTVREFATINKATVATGKTIVGNNCLIMTYSHVAHDCRIGDNVRLTNAVQLAGHVEIDNNAVIGGMAAIHQFCKIGAFAMIGATVKIVKDVIPYALIGENPAKVDGINVVGLKRNAYSQEAIKSINEFYHLIFKSGFNTSDGLKEYKSNNKEIIPEIQICVDFIENSDRGIYRM